MFDILRKKQVLCSASLIFRSWIHASELICKIFSHYQGVTTRVCPPVSMLVPNPVTATKAQIGNRYDPAF